jgi:hypothetical protein
VKEIGLSSLEAVLRPEILPGATAGVKNVTFGPKWVVEVTLTASEEDSAVS